MATTKVVPATKPARDKTTAALLKAMEAHSKKTSEASLRSLREACQKELRRIEPSLEKGATPIKGLAHPPNVEFERVPEEIAPALVAPPAPLTVTRPVSVAPAAICETSFFFPPYLGCIPNTPQSTSTPGAGIVLYEECSVWGTLGLLAVTFNDDPTARLAEGLVEKTAAATLFVGERRLGSLSGPATLTVTAPIQLTGNSLVLARAGAPPTGSALIRCNVRLEVAVFDGQGITNIVQSEAVQMCRIAAPPPFSYSEGVQNFSSNRDITVTLPVSTGDIIGVDVHFELVAGVSSHSNLYVDGNFSRLRNWFQGPGSIVVPDVQLSLC